MPTGNSVRAPSRAPLDDVAFTVCLTSLAVLLTAFSASARTGESPTREPTAIAGTAAGHAGIVTQRYRDGVPVYRLPAIHLTASRRTETAGIERERARTRAEATATARPEATVPAGRGARA